MCNVQKMWSIAGFLLKTENVLQQSCEFIVAVRDASVHSLETTDLGSLPVSFTQVSLVVLESLGQLNGGHLVWPKEKNLNFIYNSGVRYKQGSLTA